jgi:ribosome-associated protein
MTIGERVRHPWPMDDGIAIRGSVVIPSSEVTWRFSRSGGPGGQGVNTTDSRVQLVFDLSRTPSIPGYLKERALQRLEHKLVDGCLVITAQEHRSQFQNRRAAEQRLADTLRAAIAPPARSRRATKPTRASVDRRIKEKKQRGETKRLRQRRDTE